MLDLKNERLIRAVTWEYLVRSNCEQRDLDSLGEQGWEMCGVAVENMLHHYEQRPAGAFVRFYFKRRKAEC